MANYYYSGYGTSVDAGDPNEALSKLLENIGKTNYSGLTDIAKSLGVTVKPTYDWSKLVTMIQNSSGYSSLLSNVLDDQAYANKTGNTITLSSGQTYTPQEGTEGYQIYQDKLASEKAFMEGNTPAAEQRQAVYNGSVVDVNAGETLQQAYDRLKAEGKLVDAYKINDDNTVQNLGDTYRTGFIINRGPDENPIVNKPPQIEQKNDFQIAEPATEQRMSRTVAKNPVTGGIRTERSLGGLDYRSPNIDASGNVISKDARKAAASGVAPSTMDIITDPVTGNMYARDLSIPGSTYKPYTPQPAAPADTITTKGNFQSETVPDISSFESLLSQYGFGVTDATTERFQIAPAQSFKEVYSEIFDELGLSDVRSQIDDFQEKVSKLDQELANKIADINEDPWLTEGVRQQRIKQLSDRYELRKAPYATNLETLQKLWSDGREEARYVATQALTQFNNERQFQLDQIQAMQDAAESERKAKMDFLKFYQEANKAQTLTDIYGSGQLGEYALAVAQGYKGSFRDYADEDANRKARAVGDGGLSAYQTNQTFLNLTNKFQADSIVNLGIKGRTAAAIADQIIANPYSATNQLKALYSLVKNLDPDSAVREGEINLANRTQSYLEVFNNALTRISKGQVISPDAAKNLATATKELAVAWNDTANRRTKQYTSQANVANVGPQFQQYLSGFESTFNETPVGTGGSSVPSSYQDYLKAIGAI